MLKKFYIRKKLLAILIGGNIFFTGCSITGNVTSKNKPESNDISYSQSLISEETSKYESNGSEKSDTEVSLTQESIIEQTSIKSQVESINPVESSIQDNSKEESIEESAEVIEAESSIQEETSEESIEVSEEELSDPESSIQDENYKEESTEYLEDNNEEVYTEDGYYIRAKYNVNVRSEANTDSEILTLLYEGNSLKKLGYVGNWYIVDYKGNKAYVSADYTEEVEKSIIYTDLDKSNICYFPYGTTLYSDKELTNKIKDIPALESGQISRQEDNVYYVDTAGSNGYVNVSTAVFIPQPVVIVDKSEQILRLYNNNKKIMEFPVVTGNEAEGFYHPSDEGLFSIYSKSYNANLVGDTWDVIVNVFMGYNGGEGIHDATWRADYEFGGDTYLWNGSHGCINCPYSEVMELANNVNVGDKVLVKR